MARIAGVDIPRDKQARIALTYIYGVGPTISRDILKKAQVGEEVRMKDLTEEEVTRIRNIIDKDHEVELERNLLDPSDEDSTELGEVPHEPTKGTQHRYPGGHTAYGLTGMYRA